MTTSQPSPTMEEKVMKAEKSVYKETTTKRQPCSVFGRNNKRLFLSMAVVSLVVLSAFVCLFVCTYLSICPYAPFPLPDIHAKTAGMSSTQRAYQGTTTHLSSVHKHGVPLLKGQLPQVTVSWRFNRVRFVVIESYGRLQLYMTD